MGSRLIRWAAAKGKSMLRPTDERRSALAAKTITRLQVQVCVCSACLWAGHWVQAQRQPRPAHPPVETSALAADHDNDAPDADNHAAPADELQQLIADLDHSSFFARDAATQRLQQAGRESIPLLAQAMRNGSRELRLRTAWLLNQYTLDDISAPLLEYSAPQVTRDTKQLLRDAIWRDLESMRKLADIDEVLARWGTDSYTFVQQCLRQLDQASTPDQVAKAIAPIQKLRGHLLTYRALVDRLKSLSIGYVQRGRAGWEVAQTYALALRDDDDTSRQFVESYVASLESLHRLLVQQGHTSAEASREVAERAEWSSSATTFVMRTINTLPEAETAALQRAGTSPAQLRAEFFAAMKTPEPALFTQRVGQIHLVDMLINELVHVPVDAAPAVVLTLADAAIESSKTGDKSHSLDCLDALRACRELPLHHLDVSHGWGQRLADRLAAEAIAKSDPKAYQAARSIHDKILSLLDMGVNPDNEAFPAELLQAYTDGRADATAESQRLALGRYVQILQQLRAKEIDLASDPARQLVHTMRHALVKRPSQLTQIAVLFERHQRELRQGDSPPDTGVWHVALQQIIDQCALDE